MTERQPEFLNEAGTSEMKGNLLYRAFNSLEETDRGSAVFMGSVLCTILLGLAGLGIYKGYEVYQNRLTEEMRIQSGYQLQTLDSNRDGK